MKKLALLIVTLFFSANAAHACVNYNPTTNTYTVDPSGYVGSQREKNKNHSKEKRVSKPSKSKKK